MELPVLLLFMGLGGLGGGGFHPQSFAILSATYREKRAFAFGVHDSSANLGEVIGPLALGLLITVVDWRTALQIWALPGITIGVLYALFGTESKSRLRAARIIGGRFGKTSSRTRWFLRWFRFRRCARWVRPR